MRIGLKVALLRTAPFRMSRQESDFRFGSLADIPTSPRHVSFTPVGRRRLAVYAYTP